MSRYDLFRKRIAPVAFVLALALLVREQCKGQQRYHGTVVIGTGSAEPFVEAIEARVIIGDDVFGELHRERPAGMQIGEAAFPITLPEPDARVEIDVRLSGATRHLSRSIHVEEGATVRIDLGPDLR